MENMQEVNNGMDRDEKHSKDLKIMENVKKMKGRVPTPLRVMALRPGTLATFMAHRNQVMENGPLSEKTRSLIGIGVAVAMRSSNCIKSQSGTARASGANEDEIAQAVLMASIMLGASPLRSAGCCLESEPE
jgi:AhpD family alkylhydroperoxidase